MNSIAHPKRIDPSRIAAALPARRVETAIATALLAALLISFRPFAPTGPVLSGQGGDLVNQLGFGALGGLAILAMLTLARPRSLAALLSPWWLLLAGFLLLSVLNATDPPSAMRAAMFTVIGIIGIAAVLALPRDADATSRVLAVAGIATVLTCYAGLVVFPAEAVHSGDSLEPQHAGFWRGSFSHKNIAGPVMACLSFAGLYLWRRGWTWSGITLFVLAMGFMANTGSKTTAALVPLAIVLVMGPAIMGLRWLTAVLFAVAIAGTAMATLGIVFVEPLANLADHYAPGLTYTGRTALWSFSGQMIAERPWAGYGYESFWLTPVVTGMDQPFDRDWDIRGIVHGHNGYLDIAVVMGLPALAVAAVAFLVAPVLDYLRTPARRENVLLADLFMMMLLFTALNAFLESFFFRRADPVWLFFVMACLGLRLAARIPVEAHARS